MQLYRSTDLKLRPDPDEAVVGHKASSFPSENELIAPGRPVATWKADHELVTPYLLEQPNLTAFPSTLLPYCIYPHTLFFRVSFAYFIYFHRLTFAIPLLVRPPWRPVLVS
jgi:hypothetical protein